MKKVKHQDNQNVKKKKIPYLDENCAKLEFGKNGHFSHVCGAKKVIFSERLLK